MVYNLLFLAALLMHSCSAFDTAHFFRPPFLERGPWFERDWLSALYVNGAYGSTTAGKNCAGQTTCLLNIYGNHNILRAADGIANPQPILAQLNTLAPQGTFGHVSLMSKAYITETTIEWYQNFKHGFFIHAHLPVRRVKLSHVYAQDLSPDALKTVPAWQTFMQSYPQILANYGISFNSTCQRGVGDLGIALGWTHNYEEFEHLDLFDFTCQLGFTTPTSKQTKTNRLMNIPLGYNGHVGIFGKIDASIGVYDWVTFATYVSSIGFANHTRCERVKTSCEQQGLIILSTQQVKERLGPIISCGILFKADHVLRGCSFDLGYQFQHQWQSSWYLCDSRTPYNFPDQRLQSWSMHTINLELSYDFANINNPCLPQIGIIFNIPVAGKRIFSEPMGGGSFAIMTSWDW